MLLNPMNLKFSRLLIVIAIESSAKSSVVVIVVVVVGFCAPLPITPFSTLRSSIHYPTLTSTPLGLNGG